MANNYQLIVLDLKALPSKFSYKARARHGTLGEDMLDIVAERIRERTVDEQSDPSGRPLAQLRPSTIERKRRLGFPETIGVETGEMLALEQIKGTRVITDDELSMQHGIDESARQKGDWFQAGRKRRQKARPFYDIDEKAEERMGALVDETFGKIPGIENG